MAPGRSDDRPVGHSRPSDFLDAHARVRAARGHLLQRAECRYRPLLPDPQPQPPPHAVACLHCNGREACRRRFGIAGPEALNRQTGRRVLAQLGRNDLCARTAHASRVMVTAADRDRHGVEERTRRMPRADPAGSRACAAA